MIHQNIKHIVLIDLLSCCNEIFINVNEITNIMVHQNSKCILIFFIKTRLNRAVYL